MPDPTVHLATPQDASGHAAEAGPPNGWPVQRFVRRVYRLRSLGLGLGFFCVASVLGLNDEPSWLWGLLVANAFVWPHLAWRLAMRSPNPVHTEFRHLAVDSMLGGVWIAAMHFNLLPSALFLTMLTADKVAVGGTWFALRNAAVLLAACAVTSALLGFPVAIESPMPVVAACIPLLVVYPLALSLVLYGLGTKFAHQNKRLALLSSTDSLTDLANRRQGFAAAEQALARNQRRGGASSLIMLDVDHLKTVNDRFGHAAGDEVLRAVATVLRRCTRATDTPARYAGDEFLIVLPETNMWGAAELARRIRERLATTTLEHARGWRCTVSVGLSEARGDVTDIAQWIARADAALYQAKARGRDRLVSAPAIQPDDGSNPDRPTPAPFPQEPPQQPVSA